MTIFQIISIVVTLTAAGAYINKKWVKLPQTIGLMAFAFSLSLLVIALSRIELIDLTLVSETVSKIDFSSVLLHGLLSFLLFAGAMQIRLSDLRDVKGSVAVLATGGVILATLITGGLIWVAAQALGLALPFVYALLFGALISPTDPIAVLSILKEAKISKQFFTKIGGESLFNDGVGVVMYLTILSLVTSATPLEGTDVFALFLHAAFGGTILGLLFGWITYRLLKSIDDYKVEVLLTLALVTGGYALAEATDVSAPIFMVTAGLIVGNHGRSFGMSMLTRERLDVFWELVDEILNAILFILIGLEVIIIPVSPLCILFGFVAVLTVLIGRFLSVGALVGLLGFRKKFERGSVALLTWGALRGGLSVAMVLSLPQGGEKDLLLPATYIVVLFSILVQGLTFRPLLKRIVG
jgi:CPA1 family monovalent cation:H+ antiporter